MAWFQKDAACSVAPLLHIEFGEFIMAKCEICGRGPQFGNHVSFSQRHVKRRFNANVQKRKVLINGKVRRVHICTSCLKTLSKTA